MVLGPPLPCNPSVPLMGCKEAPLPTGLLPPWPRPGALGQGTRTSSHPSSGSFNRGCRQWASGPVSPLTRARTLPDAGVSHGDPESTLAGPASVLGLCRAALLVSAGILHAAGAPGLTLCWSPLDGHHCVPPCSQLRKCPPQQHRVRIMVQEGEDRGRSLVSRTPLPSRTSTWQ